MNEKVPIVIIIAVVIFVLIFIVVIASYGDSSKDLTPVPYSTKSIKSNQLSTNTVVQSITLNRNLDGYILNFNELTYKESYIFGGSMNYSTVSVYKDDVLVYSKLFSGNNGFVISNNLQNVNASFFQIGKKIDLENIKYTYIPVLSENNDMKVVIGSVASDTFKCYKCSFNYDLASEKQYKSLKNTSLKTINFVDKVFAISEYDIQNLNLKDLQDREGKTSPEKFLIQRSFDKNRKHSWEFTKPGTYIVYYIKGLYSFNIRDSKNNIYVEEKNKVNTLSLKSLNSYIEKGNVSIDYFYVTDPNITVENFDENIPEKSINSDLISLLNTPVEFYNHFVYGKKNISIDIWNRIHNKIMIFKI